MDTFVVGWGGLALINAVRFGKWTFGPGATELNGSTTDTADHRALTRLH